ETYGAVIFAALTAALFLFLAPQFHWTQGPSASGPDYAGALVLGFMTCFALVASWYPFASDYSRYLPASSSTRSVTLWPVAGVALPMILLGLFGLLLPTIDAGLASSQGVLAVISAHSPSWIAGTLTSLVFVNYVNLFGNLVAKPSFFNDGLIATLHGADLSGLISVGVATAVYWTGRRVTTA